MTSETGSSRLVYLKLTVDYRESKRKYWYKQKAGKQGKQLPAKYKRMFSNKQIVCIEYMEITEDDEREIFRVRFVLTTFLALNYTEKMKRTRRPHGNPCPRTRPGVFRVPSLP